MMMVGINKEGNKCEQTGIQPHWRALFLSVTFLFLSCNGYNAVLYDKLTDKATYSTHMVTLNDIKAFIDFEETDTFETADSVRLSVTFQTVEEYALFLGGTPAEDAVYTARLSLCADNVKHLLNSGFFDQVLPGDTLTVTAAHCIYLDVNYFYVAAVSADGKDYLPFDTGYENIVTMMDDNRSLL